MYFPDQRPPADLQHRLWRTAMDGALSWAPLSQVELLNVLDIGTGMPPLH